MENILLKNKSINKVNFFSIIFGAVLFIVFIAVAMYNSYSQYKSDIAVLEKEYINSQKKFIKDETLRILNFIEYKDRTNKNTPLEELQSEIVDIIENMRNELDGTGYVFIYTFEGINIADPILKENAGKNLIDFTDPNGKKVIYELIEVSKEPKGGYVNYVWNKPTTNTLEEKVSYAISYKPWKWMIGSGVYLKNVEEVIKEKKQEYSQKIAHYLVQIFSMGILAFIIGILLYEHLMSKIRGDIKNINDGAKELRKIDISRLYFKEFQYVAYYMNLMQENLHDLNKNLEKKVHSRTKDLEKSEQYARELVKQQDKFVKDAIHEINTPLSIIITNIDLFKLKHEENRYLSKIEAGSKIIHNIYNDLEYMIKKDRIEYPKTFIDISSFIESRLDFFYEVATGNKLFFESEIEKDLSIEFNETLLQRICDNTLSNAIKYSFTGTVITIKLLKQENGIMLQISNSGKTIRDLEKLFDRFYRENQSRGGFGIGLNIIKEICDKNGVELNVNSKDDHTTFEYRFGSIDKERL